MQVMGWMAAAVAVGGGVASGSLYSDLAGLVFLNNDQVTSTTTFVTRTEAAGYLEPDNVTTTEFAWSTSANPYLYVQQGTGPATCVEETPIANNTDRPGMDYKAFAITPPTPQACEAACCSDEACAAWVFAASAPGPFMGCLQGQHCCYLKAGVPEPVADSCCQSGVVNWTLPEVSAPPTGMRSAVPLGGVGAGSVELRADGALREWTILNASPAGNAKLAEQTDSFFAVRLSGAAFPQPVVRVLRATVPPDWPVSGVQALNYSGLYPVSRLVATDSALGGVSVALYGLHQFVPGNMNATGLPAVAFVLTATSSLSQSVSVDFLGTLSLGGYEQDAVRASQQPTQSLANVTSADACAAACRAAEVGSCFSWQWTPATGLCVLQTDVPLVSHNTGTYSGVLSTWVPAGAGCVQALRPVPGPSGGSMAVCGGTTSVAAGPSAAAILAAFVSGGGNISSLGFGGSVGAATASGVIPAGGGGLALPLAWGWNLPEWNYLSLSLGNFYANFVASGAQAAQTLLGNVDGAVQAAAAVHAPFVQGVQAGSVPLWLADWLVNSMNNFHRDPMWTRDGRFRAWEARDCVNIDSVHNSGERNVPYVFALTAGIENVMGAWAANQQADGMIQEQLACGCTGGIDPNFDVGCGRSMGDVSSFFIVYVDQMLRWGNKSALAQTLYPNVKAAALWQVAVSQKYGIPEALVTTYDILDLSAYPVCPYNGAFHILAMLAAADIADFVGDAAFADTLRSNATAARAALDALLWNETAGYYNAYLGTPAGALMADTFWAQVLAFSLHLGVLPQNATRLQLHLASEARIASTPYGLRVMTGRNPLPGPWTDNAIWQMASPNWSTQQIWLGTDVYQALADQAQVSLDGVWRQALKDQWNAAGLVGGVGEASEGLPWITSHYGYPLSSWHLTFAIAGLHADLPAGLLAFAPADTTSALVVAPFVLADGVSGTVSVDRTHRTYSVALSTGANSLVLQTLSVYGAAAPNAPITLTPGASPVTWSF